MTRLTNQQTKELCQIGAIPINRCDRFVSAVECCVAWYRSLQARKSNRAVGSELAQIEKCIWRALRLLDRATWRPAEFRRVLEDIGARLHNLSPAAQDYLQFRNLKIKVDVVAAAWPDASDPGALIDPICFTYRDDQILALRDLLGAFAGPVARKSRPGRRYKDLQRALYHFLAAAYSRDTGRSASDSSTKFMDLCSEIKRIYHLDDWNPESLARSARPPRTPRR
jgi:hypothetical protein